MRFDQSIYIYIWHLPVRELISPSLCLCYLAVKRCSWSDTSSNEQIHGHAAYYITLTNAMMWQASIDCLLCNICHIYDDHLYCLTMFFIEFWNIVVACVQVWGQVMEWVLMMMNALFIQLQWRIPQSEKFFCEQECARSDLPVISLLM